MGRASIGRSGNGRRTDSQQFHRAVSFAEANRIVAYVKKL
jgi:hypothetical protein